MPDNSRVFTFLQPMKKTTQPPRSAKFWPVMGFAALAGMRSMSAPALLSHYFSRQPPVAWQARALRFLQKPGTARLLKALAAGELVMDKLPSAQPHGPAGAAGAAAFGRAGGSGLV